jgi:hypothetical protein
MKLLNHVIENEAEATYYELSTNDLTDQATPREAISMVYIRLLKLQGHEPHTIIVVRRCHQIL